jgi:hypothetical protein
MRYPPGLMRNARNVGTLDSAAARRVRKIPWRGQSHTRLRGLCLPQARIPEPVPTGGLIQLTIGIRPASSSPSRSCGPPPSPRAQPAPPDTRIRRSRKPVGAGCHPSYFMVISSASAPTFSARPSDSPLKRIITPFVFFTQRSPTRLSATVKPISATAYAPGKSAISFRS